MKGLLLGVAVLIVGGVIGTWFGIAYTASRINVQSEQNCNSVNTLDAALVQILDRSFKGLPVNPYYKHHPDQLSKALRSTAQAVNDLQAARCTQ